MKNNIWTCIRLLMYLGIIISVLVSANFNINLGCHFVQNFGVECPACGATRATLCILKGDILSAIEYNAFYSIVIFPFFVIFVVEDIYVIIKRSIDKTSSISLIEVLFGGKV